MKLQGLTVGQRIVDGRLEPIFVAWSDTGQVWYTDPFERWHPLPDGPWLPKSPKPPLKLVP